MAVPLIPLAIMAAGLLWWSTATKDPHIPEPDDEGDNVGGVTLYKGLRTSHSGIVITTRQAEFSINMRKLCSYALVPEMVITSGIRSYAGQARAMLQVLANGEAAFKALYKDAATELLKVKPRDEGAWTPVVESLYDRNILHKSGHITGGAIDVRSRDLSTAANNEQIRAAKAAGAIKAYLDAGPCLHIDLPPEA